MKKVKAALAMFCLLFMVVSFCGCGQTFKIDTFKLDKTTDTKIKYQVTEENTVKITGYTDQTTVTEIVIPDEIDSMPVTEIADFGMFNSESLKKITIGKNVKTIGTWAFTNNQGLEEFAVDAENPYFTAVNGVLFTKDMKTLLFYPSARDIKFNNFGEAQNTSAYTIPDGVETIRSKAFYKCYYIEKISIPKSVKVIEEKAFHHCNAIKEIILPENLEKIGKDAFAYCALVEKVDIPASVTEISTYAFFNCSGMKEVNMHCKEENVKLGEKWYPTSNGRQVKECKINWVGA